MPHSESLVRALLDPKTYPHQPEKVKLVQTQMSLLLLTGDYVYKVKKPVDFGYLDYTTLEKRKFFCDRELELNRRLSPDVYLDVVPIFQQGDRVVLGGGGQVIDYAVKMKQLPADGMMDVLLPRNQVSPEMVRRVAERVAVFHRNAETSERISSFGRLSQVLANAEENFAGTERYIDVSITPAQFESIRDYVFRFAQQHADLFRRRVDQGRIRDCHGDLHSAHICFVNGISIYDCIEFNDRFRYCDVAAEVAFLAMDIDHYGHSDLSNDFMRAYADLSGDREVLTLLHFYKCHYAYVRGKVGSFKSDDPLISEEEKARTLAETRRYFELAESYSRR